MHYAGVVVFSPGDKWLEAGAAPDLRPVDRRFATDDSNVTPLLRVGFAHCCKELSCGLVRADSKTQSVPPNLLQFLGRNILPEHVPICDWLIQRVKSLHYNVVDFAGKRRIANQSKQQRVKLAIAVYLAQHNNVMAAQTVDEGFPGWNRPGIL